MKELKNACSKILDLIYPPVCPFCGRLSQEGICPECAGKIRIIREPICKKCGKPLPDARQEYCNDCKTTKHYFVQGRSLYVHRPPVSTAIYAWKYQNRRAYGKYFGRMLAEEFEGMLRKWEISVIIPIPLHRTRKRERGFDQARMLAEELTQRTGIPSDSHCLIRSRKTEAQKELGHQARRVNMQNAFCVSGGQKPMGTVLLVDDIYTTGSTLDAAASALKQAGCEKVYFLTISIGQGN